MRYAWITLQFNLHLYLKQKSANHQISATRNTKGEDAQHQWDIKKHQEKCLITIGIQYHKSRAWIYGNIINRYKMQHTDWLITIPYNSILIYYGKPVGTCYLPYAICDLLYAICFLLFAFCELLVYFLLFPVFQIS